MTSLTRPFGRLTLAGKLLLPLIAVLVATPIVLGALWLTGFLPWLIQALLDTLGANVEILRFVIATTICLVITVPIAFLVIYFEMKIIALVNLRRGPNRIGPFGSLASVVHGLKVLAKIDIVHVPFKGSGQSVISSLAGEIAANFPSVPTAIPYIKAGKLRGLGVTMAKRTAALPEVPSIAEASALVGAGRNARLLGTRVATAAATSRWSATFRARSVRSSTTVTPGAASASASADRSAPGAGARWRAPSAVTRGPKSVPCGVPKSAS